MPVRSPTRVVSSPVFAVHQHQSATRGVQVGTHDQAARTGADELPLGMRGRHDLVQLVGRVVEVLYPDRAGVGLGVLQHRDQPAGVPVHPGPAVQRRLVGPVEQQPVLLGLGADQVQQQLGRGVGRGVDVLLVGRRVHRRRRTRTSRRARSVRRTCPRATPPAGPGRSPPHGSASGTSPSPPACRTRPPAGRSGRAPPRPGRWCRRSWPGWGRAARCPRPVAGR